MCFRYFQYFETCGGVILAVLLFYSEPVLATGGDDFTNNLLSDLAPLIALFGERVAMQYLSQSMHWLEHVIFACAPLGMITAITCAIRVGGDKTSRAIIGRAREPRAQAEIDVMSSTSSDVCELWNGIGIVRVPGSPDVVELLYHKTHVGISGDSDISGFMGVYQRRDILECTTHKAAAAHEEDGYNEAPNISINTSNPAVPEKELWIVALIGVILQCGIITFDGLVAFHWRWGKNGSPVARYAFWLTFIGTLTVSCGMFICAYVIELSTEEHVWKPGSDTRANDLQILWLQRVQTVNDQSFKSYAIYAAKNQNSITTSRPLDAKGYGRHHLLTAFGTIFGIVGFVFQFIGLRGMNYWATLAQLLGMGIMTLFRVFLRRSLTDAPKKFNEGDIPDEENHYVQELPKDHELDFVAKRMTNCISWAIVTKDPNRSQERSPIIQSPVLYARIRLGQIAGVAWLSELHKTVLSLVETIETLMSHLWNPLLDGVKEESKKDIEFKWTLEIESSIRDNVEKGFLELGVKRTQIGDRGPWKADLEEIEAIMSLWISHLRKQKGIINSNKNLWIIGPLGDVGRVLSDWWISREIDHVGVVGIGATCKAFNIHEFRVLYCTNTKSADGEVQGIINATSLPKMCAQFILSNFMNAAAAKIKPIVSETIYEPTLGKRLLRISNKDVSDLADIIEKSGLATLDDAYRIVVTALFEADRLPDLTNKAPEILVIARRLESEGRTEDAKELCKRIRNMCIYKANTLIGLEKFDQAREVCMRLASVFAEQLGVEHQETIEMRRAMKNFGSELAKDLKSVVRSSTITSIPTESAHALHSAIQDCRVHDAYDILEKSDIHDIDQQLTNPLQINRPLARVSTDLSSSSSFQPFGKGKTPLALAVERGDEILVKLLLSFGATVTVEADGTTGETALHLIAKAAWNGSDPGVGEIVKLLLLNGANINDQNNPLKRTPLHLSAAAGSDAMVRLLLKQGASLDVKDESNSTALHQAAEMGHQSVIELLVGDKADIDAKDERGRTAMHRAAENCHTSVVEYLVEVGSDPTIRDEHGETAIHTAAGKGDQATVKLLLEHHADPDVKDKLGRTAMHTTAELGQAVVLKLFLEQGFDPDIKDDEGKTALHTAASAGNDAAAMLLVEHNADLDAKDRLGKRAMHRAAEKGHQTILEFLIGKGCDLEAKDMDGKTALHAAASNEHRSISELLLDNGANPDSKDNFGRTAMHIAAESACEAVMNLFLARGSDPDVNDHEGRTALHIAANNGHKGAVELLLKQQASPDARDKLGRTAIHKAAETGHQDCVELLMSQGGSMSTGDLNAETAMHIAAGKGHSAVVKFLIDSGADPNVKDKFGSAPLHKAAEGGHAATVKLLFHSGADIGARDNGRRTAMKIAQENGYSAVQKLLGTRQEGHDL